MATPKKTDRMSFEDAIGELESIIDQVESGESGLEQSLASYERGMKLIGRCKSILESAEKRIAELTPTQDGRLKPRSSPRSPSEQSIEPTQGEPGLQADDDTPF